jgi:WD40 repeat protein
LAYTESLSSKTDLSIALLFILSARIFASPKELGEQDELGQDTKPATSLIFTKDSSTLVTASGMLWLWNSATGQLKRTLASPNGVLALALSPNGCILAAGGDGGGATGGNICFGKHYNGE